MNQIIKANAINEVALVVDKKFAPVWLTIAIRRLDLEFCLNASLFHVFWSAYC